jgi:predicted transporter
MTILGIALLIGGALQLIVAIVGYVRDMRGAHYDAIATSTMFDGRWLVGSILVGAGLTVTRGWSWMAPFAAGFVGFLVILPIKMLLRALFARR